MKNLLELWIQNVDSLSTLMEVNVATPVSAKAHAFQILISINEARVAVKELCQGFYFCQSCENSSPYTWNTQRRTVDHSVVRLRCAVYHCEVGVNIQECDLAGKAKHN